MKIKRVCGVFPVFVSYVEELGNGKAGCLWFTFLFIMIVKIRKDNAEDRGLLEHELEHCRQHVYSFFFHPLLYRFNKTYRLNCEVNAYAVQLNYYPPDRIIEFLKLFSGFISCGYGLDISQHDAENLLLYKTIKEK